MDNQKLEHVLESAILPTLLQMLDVTTNLSQEQSQSHAQLMNMLQKSTNVNDTITLLAEKYGELTIPINSLINSVNDLVGLQTKQIELLKQVQDAQAENTARLDLLTLAITQNINDKPLNSMYQKLQNKQVKGV